jgi:phytoene dehydrogenase-like protein
MTSSYDVVIVGAGLAGLRAAQVLEARDLSVLLLDANDHVGGRLASHRRDGFVIDEGFQLINPSYPELVATRALASFDLRSYDSALTLLHDERRIELADPRRSPLQSLGILRSREFSLHDLVLSARLFARCSMSSVTSILSEDDMSTREGLRRCGLSAHAVEGLFQPFLRGTLLEDDLSTSWQYVQLLLRSFVRGRPGTHPNGIAALPAAIAGELHTTEIHLDEVVHEVSSRRVVTSRADYSARSVVVATDASVAHQLVGAQNVRWRSQTTWWLALPKLRGPARLCIDLDHPIASSALDVSSVAPERAPANASLIAVPANGVYESNDHDATIIESASRIYGVASSEVTLVEKSIVERALPVVAMPLRLARSQRVGDVVLAGDYLQTPSIQGALVSGRRAAQAVLRDLAITAH